MWDRVGESGRDGFAVIRARGAVRVGTERGRGHYYTRTAVDTILRYYILLFPYRCGPSIHRFLRLGRIVSTGQTGPVKRYVVILAYTGTRRPNFLAFLCVVGK